MLALPSSPLAKFSVHTQNFAFSVRIDQVQFLEQPRTILTFQTPQGLPVDEVDAVEATIKWTYNNSMNYARPRPFSKQPVFIHEELPSVVIAELCDRSLISPETARRATASLLRKASALVPA